MKRREFALSLGAGTALAGLSGPLRAQNGPVEGRHYYKLPQPVAPGNDGKIEVVAFFAYWDPHTYRFEPKLDAWARKAEAEQQIAFRRMPVDFNRGDVLQRQLFHAIELLGLGDSLHNKVFEALHVQRRRLFSAEEIFNWAKANGTDVAKLRDAMNGFTVRVRINKAYEKQRAYRIDSVPALGIQGRWVTGPGMAGSDEDSLRAADALIAQVRKG